MLLEFAIADAYGAAYEYRPLEYINGPGVADPNTGPRNDGLTYRRHGGDPAHRPGMPTDDTQMMLAVASVLAFEDEPQTRHFAEAFYALRDHLAPGYSKSMRERYATCESVEEFFEWPPSDGCGGAMRSLPVGFVKSDRRNLIARMQHHVTHSNAGRKQTESVVDAAYAAINGHALFVNGPIDPNDVVSQAIQLACLHKGTFEQLLIAACAVGGDTDTRAAIAAGLWSARTGFRIAGEHPLLMEFRGPATHLESIEQLLRKRFL